MPLERNITTRIVELLHRVPRSFVRKMHGNRMQGGGIPDIYFTCEQLGGKSIWFEVKQPGKHMSPLQEHTGHRLRRAGCVVIEVHSVEEVMAWLKQQSVEIKAVRPHGLGSRAGD